MLPIHQIFNLISKLYFDVSIFHTKISQQNIVSFITYEEIKIHNWHSSPKSFRILGVGLLTREQGNIKHGKGTTAATTTNVGKIRTQIKSSCESIEEPRLHACLMHVSHHLSFFLGGNWVIPFFFFSSVIILTR